MTSEALKPVVYQYRVLRMGGSVEHWSDWEYCSQKDYELLTGLRHHETRALYTRPAPSPELVREIAEKKAAGFIDIELRVAVKELIESAINEALGLEGVKG